MSRMSELLTFIQRLIESNRRMRDCLNAMADDRAGRGTHWQMVTVCRRVTAEDLRGE